MPTEHTEAEMRAEGVGQVTCPSCGAVLVAGLRFCRMCGYRLGEGVEEYTETRRFDGKMPPAATAAKEAPPFQPAGTPWQAAPLAPMQPVQPLRPLQSGAQGACGWMGAWSPKRMGWIGWLILSLAIMFAVGMGLQAVKRSRDARRGAPPPEVSFMREVDDLETADGGGAMIEGLAGPDTSIERAGMLGGDVITSLDGQPVRNADALRRILRNTPIGKAVEVVFIRNNEPRKTTLTLTDAKDFRGMEPIDARPGGRGRIGVNVGSRVRAPAPHGFGVELDRVDLNGPAGLAGLKKGDIVLVYNGKPVFTSGDLRLRIYEAVPGTDIKVLVMRGTELLEITLRVGKSRE